MVEKKDRGDWLQVYGGGPFYPLDPRQEDIFIEDIAHSLALQCRFNGHCKGFYSVAQHSVILSNMVSRENAKWALMHDAAEAYIGDMVRPFKRSYVGRDFRRVEDWILRTIGDKFGLKMPIPDEIKTVEFGLLYVEMKILLNKSKIPWGAFGRSGLTIEYDKLIKERALEVGQGWDWSVAEIRFLERFVELFGEEAMTGFDFEVKCDEENNPPESMAQGKVVADVKIKPLERRKILYEEAAEYVTNEGWKCKNCGRFWADDKFMARWCCATDFPCGTSGCGERTSRLRIYCSSCEIKREKERVEELFSKAELVEDYSGPFFIGERFYDKAEHYKEDVESGEVEPQEFAFIPVAMIPQANADEIWEDMLEECEVTSDYVWDANGMDEFREAVEKFNEANRKDVHYYTEDYAQKFRLPDVTAEAKGD